MKVTTRCLICVAFLRAATAYADSAAVTSMENAVPHATNGCNGALVYTPQPGTQFFPVTVNMPQGGEAFYAQAARRNVRWLETMTCKPTQTHASISNSHAATSYSSYSAVGNNWSGYQISNTAQYVQAGWFVPQVTLPSPGYADYNISKFEYDAAVWPGIGGGFGGTLPLIQSGTDSYIDINGTDIYYFWWQIYDGTPRTFDGTEITDISVNPGDEVGAVSVWVPSYSYATVGKAMLGVCNFTTGWCVHFNTDSVREPGNTTEWVVEAPSNWNGVLPLAKYGTAEMRNSCWAATTNLVVTPGGVVTSVGGGSGGAVDCKPITAGRSVTSLDLQQRVLSSPQVLSSPGPISFGGMGFNVYYHQPH